MELEQALSLDEAYINRPQNTTILGAAKFSGKTKNGWSIGLLESVTSEEFVEVNLNGSVSQEIVEPFTNYFVGRVQKDMNNRNTFLGGIFTSTNRSINNKTSVLRKEAYTAGIDFRHQWKDRTYYLQTNFIASHIKGGVDFGIWDSISTSQLSCPLDIHSGKVARKLGLLQRQQNDNKALKELDRNLRKFDKNDPAKYDFALFGLGAFEKF